MRTSLRIPARTNAEEELDEEAAPIDASSDDDGEEVGDGTGLSGLGQLVTSFLHRMVELGTLVAKPRGRMTPEKKEAHRRDMEKRALTLARDVHYPGKTIPRPMGRDSQGDGNLLHPPWLVWSAHSPHLSPTGLHPASEPGRQ